MRKYLKYIITLLVFLVIYLFVGDQSMVRRVSRYLQIRELRAEKKQYEADIREAERTIHSLENTDSLERYAREKYYMHAAGEKVYVVEN